jgi:hypothetical protein
VDPCQLRGVAHLRAVAEHAERPGEHRRRRRQPRQPQKDRVRDAARDDRADIAGGGSALGQPAGGRLVQQLREQERVAARHLQARLDEAPVRRAREPDGDQRADGRSRKRRWPQDLRGRIGEQACHLGAERGVHRPRGQD